MIDDDEAEGDKEFQLFLATNPDLIDDRPAVDQVTIRDDD